MKKELTSGQKWDLFFSVFATNCLLPIISLFIKNYLEVKNTDSDWIRAVFGLLIVLFLTMYICNLFFTLKKFW